MHLFASGVAGNKQSSAAVRIRSSKCVFVVLASLRRMPNPNAFT